MLLERDYKSLARGEFELSKLLGLLQQLQSRNPLEADPQHPRGYNGLNRDGGYKLLYETDCSYSGSQGSCKSRCADFYLYFGSRKFPRRPKGLYQVEEVVDSQDDLMIREAESAISKIDSLRSVFIRPGNYFSIHNCNQV